MCMLTCKFSKAQEEQAYRDNLSHAYRVCREKFGTQVLTIQAKYLETGALKGIITTEPKHYLTQLLTRSSQTQR